MPLLREKKNWIPLYVFLAFLLFKKWENKKAFLILIFAFLTIGVSDMTSSKIIKPFVERPRPCHTFEEGKDLRLLVNCGGGYSFTSSHATNHFAIGTFLGLIFLTYYERSLFFFLAWAGVISFAQVYVGVHYPLDVFFGGLLGVGIGYSLYRLLMLVLTRINPVV